MNLRNTYGNEDTDKLFCYFMKTILRIQKYVENSKEVTTITYYELSNGTWKTDQHEYKYRLVVTGRLNSAVKDITYTILSNTEDITFEQAWKASGLSSNSDDYIKTEDAVFVATKMG